MPSGVVEFPDGKIAPPEGPGLGLKNESLDERFGMPQAIYSTRSGAKERCLAESG